MAEECNSPLMEEAPTKLAGSDRTATDRLARGALVIVAVVVLAWLVVMERDTRLASRGLEAAGAGDVGRAQTLLRDAGFLNPETTSERVRAVLYLGRGERERAAAILRGIVRREPDNVVAWRNLILVARGDDPVLLRRAEAAVRRLDPVNSRSGPARRR